MFNCLNTKPVIFDKYNKLYSCSISISTINVTRIKYARVVFFSTFTTHAC